ncbi:MAG: BMP family ABC transporter substrate-binding protein [Polyangiaceae bacterium]|nr:BMP family ABC transporter substrate-binding protein [Polyangiaceae bacterium]
MKRERLRLSGLFAVSALAACTIVVDPDPGAGLGESCDRDEQCQASSCIDGLCAVRCGDSGGCPGGTVCAEGICHLPLAVAYVFPFDLTQDQIGRSLDEGRIEADARLGYVESTSDVGAALPGDALQVATDRVNEGAGVVVSTSALHADVFAAFAAETPDVTVLSYQGKPGSENLVAFDARTYQAYYLAGVAAGKYTTSRRIGILGSIVSPAIVANINAFALGAKSVEGASPITIELRWIGEPHDTQPKVDGHPREWHFTRAMVADNGCDVVAHTLDNSVPLYAIADLATEGMTAYAIGANLQDACSAAPAGRCLGSTFFRWGPLLSSVLDQIHRFEDLPPVVLGGIAVSNETSPIGFDVPADLSGGVSLANDLEALRAALAVEAGVGPIFDGPITSTGQCEEALGTSPCVAEGARLSDEGLASMCWLVQGIVDNAGVPARVPAEDGCAN